MCSVRRYECSICGWRSGTEYATWFNIETQHLMEVLASYTLQSDSSDDWEDVDEVAGEETMQGEVQFEEEFLHGEAQLGEEIQEEVQLGELFLQDEARLEEEGREGVQLGEEFDAVDGNEVSSTTGDT